MTSEIEICNNALTKLDSRTITSLDDNTKEAKACKLLYPQLRDDVLTAHPWNFAIEQASLSKDATAPIITQGPNGHLYRFALPSDCLRVLYALESSGERIPHKIKGRFVHASEGTVLIEYIKQETDTGLFTSQFIDTLATRLAAEIGYSLAGGSQRAVELTQLYTLKLKEAKRRDGQEGTPDNLRTSTLIDSRY